MAAVAAAVVVEGDDDGGVRAWTFLPPPPLAERDSASLLHRQPPHTQHDVVRAPDGPPTLVLDLAQPIVALLPIHSTQVYVNSTQVYVNSTQVYVNADAATVRALPVSESGRVGSSCAAGFDRYWAELRPALAGENSAIKALYRPL